MQIEITEKGFDSPVVFAGQQGIEMTSRFGTGSFACYQGQGFSFWNNHYRFTADSRLAARADMPVLELHIARSGIWKGSWEGVEDLELHPGQFNLTYTPHINTSVFFRKKMIYRSCDLHFEQYYLESLSPDFPELDRFLQVVSRGEPGSLSGRAHHCTREMTAACDAIIENPFGEKVQPYILVSKVREILVAALEKVAIDYGKTLPVFNKRQLSGLHYAKALIESSEETPPSLLELCGLTGLNEFSLKQGFRLLFGSSPYQYHVALKMAKAEKLLLDTKKSIASIAYDLGYTQASSFGHEFRKMTGRTPGEYRNRGGK